MSRIRALLAAWSPAAARAREDKIEKLAGTNRALRRDVRDLREAVGRLTRVADALQRQSERLEIVQREDASAGARLAELAMLFDVDRIAGHMRKTISAGALSGQAPQRLRVRDLWPAEVFDALLKGVPPPVFFDAANDGSLRLDVPPRLAPLAAMVTWEFVIEQIVKPILAPAVLERMALPHTSLDVSGAQLRLSDSGEHDHATDGNSREAVLVIVPLAAGVDTLCTPARGDAGEGSDANPGQPVDTLRFLITVR